MLKNKKLAKKKIKIRFIHAFAKRFPTVTLALKFFLHIFSFCYYASFPILLCLLVFFSYEQMTSDTSSEQGSPPSLTGGWGLTSTISDARKSQVIFLKTTLCYTIRANNLSFEELVRLPNYTLPFPNLMDFGLGINKGCFPGYYGIKSIGNNCWESLSPLNVESTDINEYSSRSEYFYPFDQYVIFISNSMGLSWPKMKPFFPNLTSNQIITNNPRLTIMAKSENYEEENGELVVISRPNVLITAISLAFLFVTFLLKLAVKGREPKAIEMFGIIATIIALRSWIVPHTDSFYLLDALWAAIPVVAIIWIKLRETFTLEE